MTDLPCGLGMACPFYCRDGHGGKLCCHERYIHDLDEVRTCPMVPTHTFLHELLELSELYDDLPMMLERLDAMGPERASRLIEPDEEAEIFIDPSRGGSP